MVERAEGNPLLVVETARALGRGKGERRAEPARSGARDARPLVWRRAQARRARPPSRPARCGPAELGQLPLDDPDEAAARRAPVRPAARRRRRHRLSPRVAARRGVRRDRRPRRRSLHQRWARALLAARGGRRASRARPRPRGTSGSPAPTRTRCRSSSARPPTRARSRRSSRRPATSPRRSRSPPTAPICGSRLGELEAWRVRRDAGGGRVRTGLRAARGSRAAGARASMAAPRTRLPRPDLPAPRGARQRAHGDRAARPQRATRPRRAQRGTRSVGVGGGGRGQRRGGGAAPRRARARRNRVASSCGPTTPVTLARSR